LNSLRVLGVLEIIVKKEEKKCFTKWNRLLIGTIGKTCEGSKEEAQFFCNMPNNLAAMLSSQMGGPPTLFGHSSGP